MNDILMLMARWFSRFSHLNLAVGPEVRAYVRTSCPFAMATDGNPANHARLFVCLLPKFSLEISSSFKVWMCQECVCLLGRYLVVTYLCNVSAEFQHLPLGLLEWNIQKNRPLPL